MSDNNSEWNFKVDIESVEKTETDEKERKKESLLSKVRHRKEQKSSELKLDYAGKKSERDVFREAKRAEVHEDDRYASISNRFAAFCVDTFIEILLYYSILLLGFSNAFNFVATLVIYYLYACLPVGMTGMTLGKYLLKIKILRDDEEALSLNEATAREFIGKTVSVISILGILMIIFHKQRKTLHDVLFKTIVVKKEKL